MDKPNEKKRSGGGVAFWVIAFIVVAAVASSQFRGAASYEVKGTIRQVDLTGGQATLEYIDPANGATREVTGAVPETCAITINGKPATLPDLKVGDVVAARAMIKRRKVDGKTEKKIVAKELRVTRTGQNSP